MSRNVKAVVNEPSFVGFMSTMLHIFVAEKEVPHESWRGLIGHRKKTRAVNTKLVFASQLVQLCYLATWHFQIASGLTRNLKIMVGEGRVWETTSRAILSFALLPELHWSVRLTEGCCKPAKSKLVKSATLAAVIKGCQNSEILQNTPFISLSHQHVKANKN